MLEQERVYKMAVIMDEWKTFLEKMSEEEFLSVVNG